MASIKPSGTRTIRQGKLFGTAMLTSLFAALILSACSSERLGAQVPPTTPSNPPAEVPMQEWTSADIGGTNLGQSNLADGQFTLQGMGDISDSADTFHFTHVTGNGDVGITTKLAQHGATLAQGWPKAGITIRSGLEPGAANITMYAINNEQYRGVVVQRRAGEGQRTNVIGTVAGLEGPIWLRLARDGSQVLADVSSDGSNWQRAASDTLQFANEVYLGFAVASGNASQAIGAVFEDVKVEKGTRTDDGEPGSPPTPAPTPPPAPRPDPGPVPGPQPTPPPTPNPGPKTQASYTIDTVTDFLNPERGFHSEVDLLAGTGFDNVRGRGFTLVRSYVRLDDFRTRPISDSYLNSLRNGLERLRSNGIKVVLRFSYNFGNAPDAPLNTVLQHIGQLEPILREYADVIAVMQGGFIGAWGEWHSSTNGLTSANNKRAIAEALLDALPESRMIQVRAPFHRRDVVGSPSGSVDTFGSNYDARIGFVNDCFLSTGDDTGTYGGDQTRDRRESADFSRYTVTGGETCAIGYGTARQNCPVALQELGQFHWDYLNSGFYTPILNGWRNQGCFDEISRRLGYRLALERSAVTTSVARGGSLTLDLTMRNDGFGKVYNPRPVDVVLRSTVTGETRSVRAVADVRKSLPLAGETRELQLSISIPTDMAAGSYAVLLGMPDSAQTLARDTRYNIRLANVGVWESDTGLNSLGLTVGITD